MALTWARAVKAVCRHWAAKVRAWDWSQPKESFPVWKVDSTGQRRPAMVTKYVIVAARSLGA